MEGGWAGRELLGWLLGEWVGSNMGGYFVKRVEVKKWVMAGQLGSELGAGCMQRWVEGRLPPAQLPLPWTSPPRSAAHHRALACRADGGPAGV